MADPQREFVISGEALSSRCRLNDMGRLSRGSSGIGELGRARTTRRKGVWFTSLGSYMSRRLYLWVRTQKTVKILQKLGPSLQRILNFYQQKTLSTSCHLALHFCFPHSAYCVSILVVIDAVAKLLVVNIGFP